MVAKASVGPSSFDGYENGLIGASGFMISQSGMPYTRPGDGVRPQIEELVAPL